MVEYRELSIPVTTEELLGTGGYGEVFRATERGAAQPRTFAIKYIKCTQNDEMESALTEVKALTQLNHQNIVKIFDFGLRQHWEMEVEFLLLLEFCSEGNLNTKLCEQNSRSERIRWMQCVTSAVVYLHHKGVTHQDLKPHNILLTANGDVKVADFGLAHQFARRNGQTWHSYYISQGVGALGYVAPEMLEEKHTYKVDIFSLGILFHAILERQSRMFDGERCFGVFVNTGKKQKEPIGMEMHETKRDIPVPFQGRRRKLIQKMLKYDPDQRPEAQDVEDVLRSIWRRWIQLC